MTEKIEEIFARFCVLRSKALESLGNGYNERRERLEDALEDAEADLRRACRNLRKIARDSHNAAAQREFVGADGCEKREDSV
jgi:F0F1-type ATP synthase membrane subunit b/b'